MNDSFFILFIVTILPLPIPYRITAAAAFPLLVNCYDIYYDVCRNE